MEEAATWRAMTQRLTASERRMDACSVERVEPPTNWGQVEDGPLAWPRNRRQLKWHRADDAVGRRRSCGAVLSFALVSARLEQQVSFRAEGRIVKVRRVVSHAAADL